MFGVQFVAANRLECLETLSKVDSLEGAVNVSRTFITQAPG